VRGSVGTSKQPSCRVITSLAFGGLLVSSACGSSGASLDEIVRPTDDERAGSAVAAMVTRSNGSRTVGLYGDDATGTPLTDDVAFRIGSITKSFTATTVMMLVEDGLLALDDEVAEHLDSQLVPAGVTVRNLLQHTSGIPDYVGTLNVVARSCPMAIDPLAFVKGLPPDFAPGERHEYSNTNYLILGQLIEAVTGQPPAVVIRERILDPIGLDGTYLEGSEPGPPPVPAMADFYDTGPGPIECDTPMWPDATEGGMISNFDDLDRFWRALFGGELVGAATLSQMIDTNDQGYGLGVIRVRRPIVPSVSLYGNGGKVVGYTTITYYEPTTQTTIMLMGPTGSGVTPRLLDDVIRWAFD
jgi:D-alanyl-D-alanine carboxypeptidase